MSAQRPLPPFAVLGTSGQVRTPERFDAEALLAVLGANAGNLIFQYATARLINAPLSFFGRADTAYDMRGPVDAARAVIFPAANHLRTGADWTGLTDWLEGTNKPLVVLGLGAQAPTGADASQTIAALRTEPSVMRLVDLMRERAVLVTVRGAFSQAVCDGLGLTGTLPLGCPSAFLNPNPHLGQTLARKLAALRRLPGPRLALTAAAPFEVAQDIPRRDLERRLFGWLRRTDGLYIQQSGGVAALHVATGQWDRISPKDQGSLAWVLDPDSTTSDMGAFLTRQGRLYTAAANWIAAMGTRDLVLGSRAHGTMAALAAGTPGVLIHHDARTGELARTMHLPTLDAATVMQAPTLHDAAAHIRFDAAAFDAWRSRTAAALATAFDAHGLPFNPSTRALAEP